MCEARLPLVRIYATMRYFYYLFRVQGNTQHAAIM